MSKGFTPTFQEHIAIDIVDILSRIRELQNFPICRHKKDLAIDLVAEELASMLLGTEDHVFLAELTGLTIKRLSKGSHCKVVSPSNV